jgi:hypothetical protein
LIRRLLDGLCGWLTYQQAANAKTLYNEHFLYPPIREIATGREWKVNAQRPLKRTAPGAGASKTIDFVFLRKDNNSERKPGLVFLEVKYLRNSNSTHEIQNLAIDMVKLRSTSAEGLQDGVSIPDCKPRKFILVVAQENDLRDLVTVQSKDNQPTIDMLASALRQKPPKGIYHRVIETTLKKDLHWNVIVFGESAWPKKRKARKRSMP